MNQLDAMLAEYKSLREESLQAIGHRFTIMTFMFAALGVVLTGLLTGRLPPLVAGSIALAFVPQMTKVGMLIWLGEYDRSRRAGVWIKELEKRINRVTNSGDAMGWETALATETMHMKYPYIAAFSFVLGWDVVNIFLGIYFIAFEYVSVDERWPVFSGLLIYSATVEASFILYFHRKLIISHQQHKWDELVRSA